MTYSVGDKCEVFAGVGSYGYKKGQWIPGTITRPSTRTRHWVKFATEAGREIERALSFQRVRPVMRKDEDADNTGPS